MCVCVHRGGKDCEGEMRYNPFRITPYLLKVQGAGGGAEEPCCLALAERITSGFEGTATSPLALHSEQNGVSWEKSDFLFIFPLCVLRHGYFP